MNTNRSASKRRQCGDVCGRLAGVVFWGQIASLCAIPGCGGETLPNAPPTQTVTQAVGSSCTKAPASPVAWFHLRDFDDLGQTADLANELHGSVVTTSPLPPAGQSAPLAFDGQSYVVDDHYDRIEFSPDGFTISVNVNPTFGQSPMTIAGRALAGAPGSWRLTTGKTPKLGSWVTMTVCDGVSCEGTTLTESALGAQWVNVSATVVDETPSSETNQFSIALRTQLPGQPASTTQNTFVTAQKVSFNITGPLGIGANLLAVSSDEEVFEPLTDVDADQVYTGGLSDLLLWDGPRSEEDLAAVADAGSGGLCEHCAKDVVAPVIECPDPQSYFDGAPVAPPSAVALDDCSDNPTVTTSQESLLPTEDEDSVIVTYTAEDDAGNQASCAVEMPARMQPQLPPAEKTIVTNASCTVSVTPSTVIDGDHVTVSIDDNTYTCSNGNCDVWEHFFVTRPGLTFQHWGAYGLMNQSSHTGFGGSWGRAAESALILEDAQATAVAWMVAYDSATGDYVTSWWCTDEFTIKPRITEYCDIPISTWHDRVSSGQTALHVLDPGTWNSGSGWYQGTNLDDLIVGNQHDNKIRGLDGNDCIVGKAGNDKLHGNDGADRIEGGDGNDTIEGNSGNDTLWGNAGADDIHGHGEPDWIYGGSWGDRIWAGSGNDKVWGDSANDRIWGESGADTLEGGIGNDEIKGGADGDSILGKSGCDTLEGDGGDDWIFGDEGEDRIWGGGDRDTIFGGTRGDYIRGDGGDDTIQGNADDDMICGNDGADTIQGNSGTDECRGGNGNDSMSCEDQSGRICNWNNWGVNYLWPCD